MFAVDADPAGRFAVVRGLVGALGHELWTGVVPGTPILVDHFGGLIVQLGPSAIGRFDRLQGSPIWRFESQGTLSGSLTYDEDGTLYLVESMPAKVPVIGGGTPDRFVVILDGATARVKARVPLPVSTFDEPSCLAGRVPHRALVTTPGPLIARAKAAFFELSEFHDIWTPHCENGRATVGAGELTMLHELQLLRVGADGSLAVQTLWRWRTDGADTTERLLSIEEPAPGPMTLTPQGVLATWVHLTVPDGSLEAQWWLTRLSVAEKRIHQYALPVDARAPGPTAVALIDEDDDGTIYLQYGHNLEVINITTWEKKWTLPTSAVPFLALARRDPPPYEIGVVVNDVEHGQLLDLGSHGGLVAAIAAEIADPQTIIRGNGVLHGIDPTTRATMMITIPDYVESASFGSLTLKTSIAEAHLRLAVLGLD